VSTVLVQTASGNGRGWVILKGDVADGRVAHCGDALRFGIGQALLVGTSRAHPAEPKLERNTIKRLAPSKTDKQAEFPGESPRETSAVAVWFGGEEPRSGQFSKTAASVAQWSHNRPQTIDALVAIFLFALGIYSTRLSQLAFLESQAVIEKIRPGAEAAVKLGGKAAAGGTEALRILAQQPHLPPLGWLYFLGALSTLPLIVRRHYPDLVHVLIFSGFLVTLWVFPFDSQIASLTAWLSTYNLAAYGRANPRIRQFILALTGSAIVLLISGVVRNHEFNPDPLTFRQVFFYILLTVVLYGAPILFGSIMRRHLATLDQLRSRTATLQQQQLTLHQQQGDLERTAILNERVRIARELHDVVAHHVSVMGMQAGAARLTLGATDTPVSNALSSIEQSSREAVANLQQLLGFLRSGQATGQSDLASIASPQPNLSGLPLLIDEHRSAGYEVAATLGPGLDSAQPGLALSAYRIVQEALTNIRKHAPREDETTIEVRVEADTLHIAVTNRPPVGAARITNNERHNSGLKLASTYLTGRSSAGLGLRGMNERVELHNGRFAAGPTASGGFAVEASLVGARHGSHPQSASDSPITAEPLSNAKVLSALQTTTVSSVP
jgi:signal transduction histidine kinase